MFMMHVCMCVCARVCAHVRAPVYECLCANGQFSEQVMLKNLLGPLIYRLFQEPHFEKYLYAYHGHYLPQH